MGITRLPSTILNNAKQLMKLSSLPSRITSRFDVPRGHVAIYVGYDDDHQCQKKRFLVPISHLNHPSFQELLNQVEEEFGFDPPVTGALRIPCQEEVFIHVISRLL